MQDRVRIQIDDLGVAEVALIRADKMNALDVAMFDALQAVIKQLETTPYLRAVVLHGEGKAFCAGLDMGRFAGMAEDVAGVLRRAQAKSAQYARHQSPDPSRSIATRAVFRPYGETAQYREIHVEQAPFVRT